MLISCNKNIALKYFEEKFVVPVERTRTCQSTGRLVARLD